MSLYAANSNQRTQRKSVKMCDLDRFVGRWVHCAGILLTGKVVHTKHGDSMQFLTFEDDTGLVETTFFPQVYRRFCAILGWGGPFCFMARLMKILAPLP